MLSLLIDGFIITLLAAAIVYGMIISRRVDRLMNLLRDLEPIVQEFSAAVDKSEKSVEDMRVATERKVQIDRREPAVTRRAEAPAAEPAPAPQGSGIFASRRGRGSEDKAGAQPIGLIRLGAKADLVRGFFESTRSRPV